MKKLIIYKIPLLLLVVLLSYGSAFAQLLPNFGGARLGTASFQFTKIIVDARSASMGGSVMADASDASSLYWNPALAAEMKTSEFMAGHTAYFADISMEYLSYVHRFNQFAIGGSVQYLNSGAIKETTEFQPFGTGRTFGTIHFSAGISAAQKLTDLFSYGLKISYLEERIEEISIRTGAIDFGFFYRVSDTGLRFSVGINNFGLDGTASGTTTRTMLNGEVEEEPTDDDPLPTKFNIAAAYDVFKTKNSSVIITSQITNPSDNSERFSFGAEYAFMKQFFLRAGYEFGTDERNLPSLGAGVEAPFMGNKISADYAFTNYERLGNIHRIALRVGL